MVQGKVRAAVQRANSQLSIKLAASLLSVSLFVGAGLGLLRDRLFNRAYLPNEALGTPGYTAGADAYTAAFTIPDFMFYILVSGALSVTFIPVFTKRLATGNRKSAWQLSTSLINLMALVTLVASILIIIFADPLVRYVIGPGFDESTHGLAVSMMRVIAVNPFLFAISAVITSMQQAVNRYTFYALAPIMYNIGIITGILYFSKGVSIFGVELFAGGIMGVALGVVFGSMLQLIVACIGLIGFGFDYQFKIFWRNKGFREVLRLLPPRSIDQSADYLTTLVETNLSSRLAEGTVRAYNQASVLHIMPVNLIGVAISTAAFPSLSEYLAKGRPDLFKKELQQIIRVIIWLALPVSMITYFTRGYVVNFIKEGGDPLMSGLLGALVIAILFRTIFHIASRGFYAQQDTKTPLYISLVAIALNIILAIVMTIGLDFGAYGLAWAASITAVFEVVLLFIVMSRRVKGLFDKVMIHAIARMLSATGFMGVVTYVMVKLLPLLESNVTFFATLPKFLIIVAVSFAVYVVLSSLLKLEEPKPVIAKATQIAFGRVGGRGGRK